MKKVEDGFQGSRRAMHAVWRKKNVVVRARLNWKRAQKASRRSWSSTRRASVRFLFSRCTFLRTTPCIQPNQVGYLVYFGEMVENLVDLGLHVNGLQSSDMVEP